MHKHNCYAMRGYIKRAYRVYSTQFIHVLIYLRAYPLKRSLGQSDKVESSLKHLRKIGLRVIAVVCYYLSISHSKSAQLIKSILYSCDIRQVTWLLCECNGLPGIDRVQSEQFNSLQSVFGFVESISGIYLIL